MLNISLSNKYRRIHDAILLLNDDSIIEKKKKILQKVYINIYTGHCVYIYIYMYKRKYRKAQEII